MKTNYQNLPGIESPRIPRKSSSILPHRRRHQHKHRIELKTSGKHVEHEDVLGDRLHDAEVAGGTDLGEAGSDVVEGTGHGRENGLEVVALKYCDRQDRQEEQQHVSGQIDAHAVDGAPVHGLSVHGDVRDGAGMQVFLDLAVNGLAHDHDSGDLHTAAGTAGAGAAEHDQDEQGPGVLRPLVKVRRRETGRRDDRADLESRVMEGQKERREHAPDVDRDRDDRECDDAKISLQLTHLQHFTEFSPDDEEVRVKVDAEHDDEHRDDALHQRGVAGAAVIANAESACSGTAEGDAESVKQGHSRDQQEDDLRHGDAEVDGVQYFGGVFHARDEFADRRARALRPHQVHVVAAGHGKDRQDEDDDAHSADPVREAAPEQARVAEGLDIRQDTGSGRRKAGYGLKKRVRKAGNVLCDHERDRSQDTDDDPAQSDNDKSFSCVVSLTLKLDRSDDLSDDKIDNGQYRVDNRLLLPVEQATEGRESQESPGELDHDSQYSPDN